MISYIFCIQIIIGILIIAVALKIYLVLTSGICTCKNKLNGKVVIVTGSSGGLGKETAMDLAARGARVIMACRDLNKAEQVKNEIIQTTGNEDVIVKYLELASLKSVRSFAADILRTEERLDILINNAGCTGLDKRLTEDGFEYHFQTNYLGHFLLTNLLLGLMKASAPARIINVSSVAHVFVRKLDFGNLNSEITYNKSEAYCKSKLCQILMSSHLAPLISNYGVTINSLHPGAVKTEIARNIRSWILIFLRLLAPFIKSVKEGAQTTIHLAVADELADVTGKYFSDCKMVEPSNQSKDKYLAKKLWDISEKFVDLKASERHF